MLIQKRRETREGTELKPACPHRGWIATGQGLVVTSAKAMELVRNQEDAYLEKNGRRNGRNAQKMQRFRQRKWQGAERGSKEI